MRVIERGTAGGRDYYYTTLGGWVLASLELETRLLLRRSLHRRRVSKVAYPFFLELLSQFIPGLD